MARETADESRRVRFLVTNHERGALFRESMFVSMPTKRNLKRGIGADRRTRWTTARNSREVVYFIMGKQERWFRLVREIEDLNKRFWEGR